MKEFKGRIVTPGTVTAEAVVTHGGLNTLASFQKALQFGDKNATCGDQNNPDLYGKQMAGKALCLPQTIGSTTGGMVLYCACAMGRQPACMLFSNPVDSLAAAGSILASVWLRGMGRAAVLLLSASPRASVSAAALTAAESGTSIVRLSIGRAVVSASPAARAVLPQTPRGTAIRTMCSTHARKCVVKVFVFNLFGPSRWPSCV